MTKTSIVGNGKRCKTFLVKNGLFDSGRQFHPFLIFACRKNPSLGLYCKILRPSNVLQIDSKLVSFILSVTHTLSFGKHTSLLQNHYGSVVF
jgi:hypothetical protein